MSEKETGDGEMMVDICTDWRSITDCRKEAVGGCGTMVGSGEVFGEEVHRITGEQL